MNFDLDPTADELLKIRHALDAARQEVKRLRPDLAHDHLRSIRSEMEKREGTAEWAEYRLMLANIFAAKKDTEPAEEFYREALKYMGKLPTCPVELRLRIHEDFGRFLDLSAAKPSEARIHYAIAKEIAVANNLKEDTARIELRIIKVDLQTHGDRELENFKILKRVAKTLECPHQDQLAAWIQHRGESQDRRNGITVARQEKLAAEAYFKNLLYSVTLE